MYSHLKQERASGSLRDEGFCLLGQQETLDLVTYEVAEGSP
jgi:hypothetical protein